MRKLNKYCNLSNGTSIVELTQGQWTILDTEDWEKIKEMKWFAKLDVKLNGYYAHHTTKRDSLGNQKTIRMHRLIVGTDLGDVIDHINGDTLDNRKCNLRMDLEKRNNQNYRKPSNNTSGFKGVYWFKRTNQWKSQISCNNIKMHLGLFDDINKAIEVYDMAACYYFKDFCKLNFEDKKEEYIKKINANQIDSHLDFKKLV